MAVWTKLDASDAATAGHAHPDGVALAVPDHLHHGLVRTDGHVPANNGDRLSEHSVLLTQYIMEDSLLSVRKVGVQLKGKFQPKSKFFPS